MIRVVRTSLLAALALASVVSCGGGGGSSPPASPPAAPPTSPPPPPPPPAGPAAPPSFTSPVAVTVRENAAGVVYRAVATDPNGDAITYTMTGPDAARFSMNPVTQEVRFVTQPDFEAPADVGGNNVYDLTFSASDGTSTVTQNVAITVSNVANGFHVRRVVSGLSAPIYVTGLPDGSGRIVVVERAGRIRVVTPSTGAIAATDFLNITSQIDTSGEKGLISIAFSPNFLVDRTFYLHMNPNVSNTSEIRQYHTLSTAYDQADASTANTILSFTQEATTNHKGGFLAFDKSGRLLAGYGDGGGGGDPPGNGQNPNVLMGKLLRIDPTTDAFPTDNNRDYGIPAGNPFAIGGGSPEIFALGLRNPFRGSVDPVTGDIFVGDVGQDAIEEVDRIPVNASGTLNYGWNRREGTQPYNGGADSAAFTRPVVEYPHGSGAQQGNSITGGVVYRGPVEDLQGQYIFGDYISGNVWTIPSSSLVVGSTQPNTALTRRNTDFAPNAGTLANIVAFGTNADFNVYMVNLNSGEVFEIEP
ncbi:MAG TPA: PQQ-dependent sugar dehydrogenase [Hyphomonadaceae bacterium]|nr:PQQ-dependent sugar dehydrogenase [Hyphomonadaceae bacterium]